MPQQLGGLGLHAAGALERLPHEVGADLVEQALEVEAVRRAARCSDCVARLAAR